MSKAPKTVPGNVLKELDELSKKDAEQVATHDEFEQDLQKAIEANRGRADESALYAAKAVEYAAKAADTDPYATVHVGGYDDLRMILDLALDQAASGKGRNRHAVGPVGFRPWADQPILANARQVGPGGPAMQVMKKVQEAVTMAGNGNLSAAQQEALGAIVYAAALFKLLREMEIANNGE